MDTILEPDKSIHTCELSNMFLLSTYIGIILNFMYVHKMQ
jgi:hypothetical protein